MTYCCFSGQAGFIPQELAETICWNRTVNVRGGLGHNIEMDLWNEFLNRDFVGMTFQH